MNNYLNSCIFPPLTPLISPLTRSLVEFWSSMLHRCVLQTVACYASRFHTTPKGRIERTFHTTKLRMSLKMNIYLNSCIFSPLTPLISPLRRSLVEGWSSLLHQCLLQTVACYASRFQTTPKGRIKRTLHGIELTTSFKMNNCLKSCLFSPITPLISPVTRSLVEGWSSLLHRCLLQSVACYASGFQTTPKGWIERTFHSRELTMSIKMNNYLNSCIFPPLTPLISLVTRSLVESTGVAC